MPGKVYLIGAGPGDPELLTCKGRRILEHADSILFDHLAPAALLDLAPPSAERIYVGKKKSDHAFTHEENAVDWKTVGQADTLVIFMGMSAFAEIARALISAGRSPETPAIAVRWATRPDQESIEGTLASLPQLIAEGGRASC